MRPKTLLICTLALSAGFALAPPASEAMTAKQQLGHHLYMDTSLSLYKNQSCMTCHHPMAGWADPDNTMNPYDSVVSTGSDGYSLGGREAPPAAYAAFSPVFGWDTAAGMYIGGQFWDGRAPTLAEQAKGPFLNPAEMAMPSKAAVVNAVKKAPYAWLFLQVYGKRAFNDVERAYGYIADAIAAFEASGMLNRFSSKYDAYLAGTATLTAQEARGLALFNGKANCAACHPSDGTSPLFTDFSYDNLGIPKSINPQLSGNPVDYGLGGRAAIVAEQGDGTSVWDGEKTVVVSASQAGKFKVPSLRNIAKTPPYGHNGYFATLREVVDFYNTGLVSGIFVEPEVPLNVNRTELGNLGLTPAEVDDLVAFLRTLSDVMGGGGMGGGGMGGGGM